MAIPTKQIIQVTSRTGFKTLLIISKYFTLLILFSIVFAHAILQSFNEQSPIPFFEIVGQKLVLVTQDLLIQSKMIIEIKNIYIFDKGFFENMLEVITIYSNLILAIYILIAWLRIFSTLWAHGPFSFPGNRFANFMMGSIFYIFIQGITILIFEAIKHNIIDFKDGVLTFFTPITMFYYLFLAVIVLILPVSRKIIETLDTFNSTSSNMTFNSTNSTNITYTT